MIFNPVAQGGKARRFRRHLGHLASDGVFKPTTGPGSGRRLAAEAVRDRFSVIVSVGGDGTLNEVLNGIGDVPGGFEQVAVGVIPLGTANVFAWEMGIPVRMRRAWHVVHEGRRTRVDLGRVRFQANDRREERWFVQLGGAGLDARAVERVDWVLKKQAGWWAYVLAGLCAIREPQPTIRVVCDQGKAEGQLVLLGGGRYYGGPFTLLPQARNNDGLIDARVFPRADWRMAAAIVLGILTRRHGSMGGGVNLQARRLRMESDLRVPLQIDGELVGQLPAEFEVFPRALQVIVP